MVFDSDKGIARSVYHDASEMNSQAVDELIVRCHNGGWSQGKIARYLRQHGAQPATQQGVGKALKRIAAGRVGAGPRG
jgi:hypothetical protein